MFLTTNRLETINCQSIYLIYTTIHCRYDVKPNRTKATMHGVETKLIEDKKHWCTHQSYGPKTFPREHYCFHKQNVFLAYELDNVKITLEFQGDPLFKSRENI